MKRTAARKNGRAGFSLLALVVALAVVAVLAGVLGPMLYRQAMQAKVDATRDEMAALQDGLLRFHADTGRFPTAAEGLAALVRDPGADGWRGPYLGGQRRPAVEEMLQDAFGNDYVYDLAPTTSPARDADLLLASGGLDGAISNGGAGLTWVLDHDTDDLLVVVDAEAEDRLARQNGEEELRALVQAAQTFFEDNAAYPTTTVELVGTYLDAGPDNGALSDPWRRPYLLVVDSGAHPPTLAVRSSGPDGVDAGGGEDDLLLVVDSTVPGRRATTRLLGVAQSRLNAEPTLALTGDWSQDGAALGLGTPHLVDGWNQPLDEAVSLRTVVSAGPDGDFLTAADNLPPGIIPDEGSSTPPDWDANGYYTIGDLVTHNGQVWECLQTHQCYGDPNWAPGVAPSLWALAE